MSKYDRGNGLGNHDTPDFTPLEPVDWFTDDPLAPADATLFPGRIMFKPGVGLVQSVDGLWVGLPRKLWVPAVNIGYVAGTPGWTTSGADGLLRLGASVTSAVWLTPLTGLNIGDRVKAVRAVGQVESAGNTVTVLLDVKKTTAAAADFVEAALGSQATTGALTADTLIQGSVLEVANLTEVLDVGEHFFAILTGTTGISTDVAIAGFEVEIG